MTDKTYNVLFICTGNAARSILAEGLVNERGGGACVQFGRESLARLDAMAIHREIKNIGTR